MPTTAPRDLPAVVVYVADCLPEPPHTFTVADVLDTLSELRTAEEEAVGVEASRFGTMDAGEVLDALLRAELASVAEPGPPARYTLHTDARPF